MTSVSSGSLFRQRRLQESPRTRPPGPLSHHQHHRYVCLKDHCHLIPSPPPHHPPYYQSASYTILSLSHDSNGILFLSPTDEGGEEVLTKKEKEERRIAEMGRPMLGEHIKLEVIIEESYEFKVGSVSAHPIS